MEALPFAVLLLCTAFEVAGGFGNAFSTARRRGGFVAMPREVPCCMGRRRAFFLGSSNDNNNDESDDANKWSGDSSGGGSADANIDKIWSDYESSGDENVDGSGSNIMDVVEVSMVRAMVLGVWGFDGFGGGAFDGWAGSSRVNSAVSTPSCGVVALR